jgi:hypothetical protein
MARVGSRVTVSNRAVEATARILEGLDPAQIAADQRRDLLVAAIGVYLRKRGAETGLAPYDNARHDLTATQLATAAVRLLDGAEIEIFDFALWDALFADE